MGHYSTIHSWHSMKNNHAHDVALYKHIVASVAAYKLLGSNQVRDETKTNSCSLSACTQHTKTVHPLSRSHTSLRTIAYDQHSKGVADVVLVFIKRSCSTSMRTGLAFCPERTPSAPRRFLFWIFPPALLLGDKYPCPGQHSHFPLPRPTDPRHAPPASPIVFPSWGSPTLHAASLSIRFPLLPDHILRNGAI